jgi:CO dehydrogenase/acetyl-CoA synthase alpha subunit
MGKSLEQLFEETKATDKDFIASNDEFIRDINSRFDYCRDKIIDYLIKNKKNETALSVFLPHGYVTYNVSLESKDFTEDCSHTKLKFEKNEDIFDKYEKIYKISETLIESKFTLVKQNLSDLVLELALEKTHNVDLFVFGEGLSENNCLNDVGLNQICKLGYYSDCFAFEGDFYANKEILTLYRV